MSNRFHFETAWRLNVAAFLADPSQHEAVSSLLGKPPRLSAYRKLLRDICYHREHEGRVSELTALMDNKETKLTK